MIDYFCAALALQRDNRAVTAIEYALIAALIAVVIIAAVSNTGTKMELVFNKVSVPL